MKTGPIGRLLEASKPSPQRVIIPAVRVSAIYQPAVLGMLRAAAMAPLPIRFKEPSLSKDRIARGGLDYLHALLAMPGNWILFRPSRAMATSPNCFVNIWRDSISNGHRNFLLVTPKGHYTFLRPGVDSTSPFGVFPFLPYKRQEITPVSLIQANGPSLVKRMTHRLWYASPYRSIQDALASPSFDLSHTN